MPLCLGRYTHPLEPYDVHLHIKRDHYVRVIVGHDASIVPLSILREVHLGAGLVRL